MKKTISILIFINSILLVSAQKAPEAQQLINNFLQKIKTEAVRTDFNLKVIPKNNIHLQSVSGSLIMKGNQFYLTMDEVEVWYNGTIQWALFNQNNEVTITEPNTDELAETNPMAVLAGYTARSKVAYSKKKSNIHHIIELTPVKTSDQFVKVTVQFVKTNNNLHSIHVINKDGSRNELELVNYRSQVPVQASTFRFDKAKHPGVTVNDLR